MKKDKEAFVDYMAHRLEIYSEMDEWEKEIDESIWEDACKYKNLEIDELKSKLKESHRLILFCLERMEDDEAYEMLREYCETI